MDKLLPCPYCGSEPKMGSMNGDQQNWCIWCPKCQIPCLEWGNDSIDDVGENKRTHIQHWNTRTPRLTVEDVEKVIIKKIGEYVNVEGVSKEAQLACIEHWHRHKSKDIAQAIVDMQGKDKEGE